MDEIKKLSFYFKERTYSDNVKSHLNTILMDMNRISEKDFKRVDEIINLTNNLFNNIDLTELTELFESLEYRYQYCAECIFATYFMKNEDEVNEKKSIKDVDVRDSIKYSKTLDKDKKELALSLVTSNSKYRKGRVIDLQKPHGTAERIGFLGLGLDNNGFFVYTHRCRSKSHEDIDKIPQKEIDFVKSTS